MRLSKRVVRARNDSLVLLMFVHVCTCLYMFVPDLPGYEGTVLQVQCFGGAVQLGSGTVTCEKDQSFTYDSKPECRKLGNGKAVMSLDW